MTVTANPGPPRLAPEYAFEVLATTGGLDARSIRLFGWFNGDPAALEDAPALAALRYQTVQDLTLVKAVSEGAFDAAYGARSDVSAGALFGRWGVESDTLRCLPLHIQPVAFQELGQDEIRLLTGELKVPYRVEAFRVRYQCAMPSVYRDRIVSKTVQEIRGGGSMPTLPALRRSIEMAGHLDAAMPMYFAGEVSLLHLTHERRWLHSATPPAWMALDRSMGDERKAKLAGRHEQAAIVDGASAAFSALRGAASTLHPRPDASTSTTPQIDLSDDLTANVLLRFPAPLRSAMQPSIERLAKALAARAHGIRCKAGATDTYIRQESRDSSSTSLAWVSVRCRGSAARLPLPVGHSTDDSVSGLVAYYGTMFDAAAGRAARGDMAARDTHLAMVKVAIPEGHRWQPESGAMANLLLGAVLPDGWMEQLQRQLLPRQWLPPEVRYDALDPAALDPAHRAVLQDALDNLRPNH